MTVKSKGRVHWQTLAIGLGVAGAAVLLIGVVLFLVLVVECNSEDYTVFERVLDNGDELKMRMEYDCSFTGGERFNLYVKTLGADTFRPVVTSLRRASGETTEAYVKAPTPLILLHDSSTILLRNSERWNSFSVVDLVNRAIPPDLPLATYARIIHSEDGFDAATNTLTLTANWGWVSRRVTLQVLENREFSWLTEVPTEEASTAIPEIASTGAYHVRITPDARMQIWRREEINVRLPAPPPMLVMPVGCPTESLLSCAVARVHVAPVNTAGEKTLSQTIDWVGISWPAEPRRYTSSLHSIRYGTVIHFDAEFVAAHLGGFEINNPSVRMEGVGHVQDSGKSIDQIWFTVMQAPIASVSSSSYYHQSSVVTLACPNLQLKFRVPPGIKLTSSALHSDEMDVQIKGFPEQCTRSRIGPTT